MIFEDWRIEEIISGSNLTEEERNYLISDTPRFEECDKTSDELSKLSDVQLIETCYRVWSDYCR